LIGRRKELIMRRPFLTPRQTRALFGRVALEIYAASSKVDEAADAYEGETGEDPRDNQHFQTYEKKWGRQHRIYFNEDDSDMAEIDARYDVHDNDVPYLREYSHRINDPSLFWMLVSAGCRLGHNAP
jgi:hypothetical protein